MNISSISPWIWAVAVLAIVVLAGVILRRRVNCVYVFLGVGFLALILVALQKPWRRPGALHFVNTARFGTNTISVAQVHDGYGLNSTYVVIDGVDGSRKWYPIGNDDIFWYRVAISAISNEIRIGSVAAPIATVNASNLSVRWYGHEQFPSFVEKAQDKSATEATR